MAYVIDTSCLIRAWYEAYPIDVLPPFWDRLAQAIADGTVISTMEVYRELEKKDRADLFKWAKQHKQLFHELDEGSQAAVSAILTDHPRLVMSLKGRTQADPFVIALAAVGYHTVVTEERAEGNDKRPRIPNVCAAKNIECINLLGMIRALGWTFGSAA